MEKQCNKCKVVKDISAFSKYKEGHKSDCKMCINAQSKERRTLNGCNTRIDRSSETEHTKICTNCLALKDKTNFKHKSWCTECIKSLNRKYSDAKGVIPKLIPIFNEVSKQCLHCLEIKPLEEYGNSTRGRLGKAAYCKKCISYLQLTKWSTKEERREKTQNYRHNNREWCRFLHRINQFNRKNKIKKASDGSVTKEFMKEIYETEVCYYCKSFVKIENRTCEHKQPLNKGGVHGVSNLTMACNICNFTKRDMTEIEFNEYLNIRRCKKK